MVLGRNSVSSSRQLAETTLFERVRWLGNTIFHQLVTLAVGFIVYILFKYNDYTQPRFLHYILCALAYIPLMAEGIMLFSEANVWSLNIKRGTKYYIHGPVLAISVVAVSVGIIIEINSKNERGSSHFTTIHGILGLTSWILSMVCVIGGLAGFFSVKLKKIVRPVVVKFAHNILGLAAFIIGVAALIYGLKKGSFRTHVTDTEYVVSAVLVSVIGAWTGIMVLVSAVNQLKSIIS